MTREEIEQLNEVEPYCFETDREEQWFNIGLRYGLDVAGSDPKSPWISVNDDLPCNHKELLHKDNNTKRVLVLDNGYPNVGEMFKMRNGNWGWLFSRKITHWMPIPEPPKEQR